MANLKTIRDLLAKTRNFLAGKDFSNPRLEAELLLSYVLSTDRVHLYMDIDMPLSQDEVDRYRAVVLQRVTGKPVSYITGEKEFYSLSFMVNESVLIPRPDSEHLIDVVKNRYSKIDSMFDIGTGSGVLAITLKKLLSIKTVVAVDISEGALQVASTNCEKILGEKAVIDFRVSDLYASVSEKFDLIVSNPPYVTEFEYDALDNTVRNFEPKTALVGGADGCFFYDKIIQGGKEHLNNGGVIVFEISDTVALQVQELALVNGFERAEIIKDYADHQRVMVIS